MAAIQQSATPIENAQVNTVNVAAAKKQVVWAVGGGKGGVGKSLISSSLGIVLARQGHRVTLVDLDLGGANLHTCVGVAPPPQTLSDFLKGRVPHLDSLITQTEVKGLQFISGANDALDIAGLDGQPKETLMRAIRGISSDFIILDLGAGTSLNTLDFFLQADKQIISILPEPTSIENAYRFIKAAFYRRLKVLEEHLGVKKIIDEAMDHKNALGIRTPFDLLNHISKIDPIAGRTFRAEIAKMHINLIVNQVRTSSDIEMGNAVKSVCQKYFGIQTDYVGYLDHDNAAWQALRKRRPMLLEYPYSNMVGQFHKIVRTLTSLPPA